MIRHFLRVGGCDTRHAFGTFVQSECAHALHVHHLFHVSFCRGEAPPAAQSDHRVPSLRSTTCPSPCGQSAPGAPAAGSPTAPIGSEDRRRRRAARRRRPRHECPRREPHQRHAQRARSAIYDENLLPLNALSDGPARSTRPTGPASSSTPSRRPSAREELRGEMDEKQADLEAALRRVRAVRRRPGRRWSEYLATRAPVRRPRSPAGTCSRRPTAATWTPTHRC